MLIAVVIPAVIRDARLINVAAEDGVNFWWSDRRGGEDLGEPLSLIEFAPGPSGIGQDSEKAGRL